MKPRGLCNLDGCVYLAGHRCDHSWNRPYSTRVAEPTVDDAALSPDAHQHDTSTKETA